MDLPIVSVLFITYKRIDLLKRTYESFLENTDYPREKLELILCDDGSPENIQEEMKSLKFDKFLLARKNQGMGANVNKGIKSVSGEFILQLQDDWECRGPKDYLRLGIQGLEQNDDVGIIRYRLGIKYPNFTVRNLNNMDHRINVLEWDQGDDSISRFIYSDNPHLKKTLLHKKVGQYKVFNKMHKTELDFCNRFNSFREMRVAYIQKYEEVFVHIGIEESLRKKEMHNRIKNYLSNNFLTRKFYIKLKDLKN